MIDLFADTNIGAAILKARGSAVAAAFEGKPVAPATFDIDFMRKDLREMLQEAHSLGLPLPVARRTLTCFDQAARASVGQIDATQYPAWWISHMREPQHA